MNSFREPNFGSGLGNAAGLPLVVSQETPATKDYVLAFPSLIRKDDSAACRESSWFLIVCLFQPKNTDGRTKPGHGPLLDSRP